MLYFSPAGAYDDYARKVLGVFDAISVLVIKELAEPELFYDLYAGMVVRVAKALDEHIQRETKVNPEYCKWFRQLNRKCKDYYTKKHEPIPEVYCRDS